MPDDPAQDRGRPACRAFCHNGRNAMRHLTLLAATAALALSAGMSMAQDKKQLVIVVKGLDNPFFEAIHQGCEKWNSENADSEYDCFYTGPASTSDEAGEAQIIQDLLALAHHRRDRHLAVERPADRADHQVGQSDHPGHDDRRRPREGGRGAAQDLSRHRQLHYGLQDRRVHQGEEAGRRHDLHHRGQPRRRQHPAPRPGHA